jgi:hypothetical protein
MEGQEGSPENTGTSMTAEEFAARLQELERKNLGLSESVTKLTSKNSELITENRKRTRMENLLRAIDIDPADESAEDLLAQKLAAARAEAKEVGKAPEGDPAPVPGTAAPHGDASPEALEMKSQLKSLQRKLTEMEKKAEQAEIREREAVEKRQRDFIELRVKEALQKAGCINPSHFFVLKGSEFKLSEDGSTIISGTDGDPRSLDDQIETYKDDSEFGMYFRGSNTTGSGMAKGNTFGGQSLKNPFRTDQRNLTDASGIIQKDPERAKRLMIEARTAGKLDPVFAKSGLV